MARPTRLRVTEERLAESGDIEEGSPLAAALAAQQPAAHPNGIGNGLGTTTAEGGAQVLDYLRTQLAERNRELETEKQRAKQIERHAEDTITQAYEEATGAVNQLKRQRAQAEQRAVQAEKQAQQKSSYFATVSLATVKQGFEQLAWLVAFLVNKLPALAALYGGFLLWSQTLPNPSVSALIGLGLYGALLVAPFVWLASRPQKNDTD